jgi:hypothetical protein
MRPGDPRGAAPPRDRVANAARPALEWPGALVELARVVVAAVIGLPLVGCATVERRDTSAWGFTAEYGPARYKVIGLSPDQSYCDGARRTAVATWPIANVSACAPVTIGTGTDYWLLPMTSDLPALGFADEARCTAWGSRLGYSAMGCQPVSVKAIIGAQ